MKKKTQSPYPEAEQKGYELREIGPEYVTQKSPDQAMIRTQIYLSRSQHEFVQAEANRRNTPMAEVIRGFIDASMNIPEDAWAKNPMLSPADQAEAGPEDGSLNHDHYVYGSPKRFAKKGAEWVETPVADDSGAPTPNPEKNS